MRIRRSLGLALPSSAERAHEPSAPRIDSVDRTAAERDEPGRVQADGGEGDHEKDPPPHSRLLVPKDRRDELGDRIPPVGWDLMGADGLDDKIGDLPVDEAPAVPIEEMVSAEVLQMIRNALGVCLDELDECTTDEEYSIALDHALKSMVTLGRAS